MKILTFVLAIATLLSPDGKLAVNVNADRNAELSYSVSYNGAEVIFPSAIGLTLYDGTVLAGNAKPSKIVRRSVDRESHPIAYKRSTVRDNFNEMSLVYKTYKVIFRAYDEGVAYRFVSLYKTPVKVKAEKAEFNFAGDWNVFIPYARHDDAMPGDEFQTSFESLYNHNRISECDPARKAFLPIGVQGDGVSVVVTESDLVHYPGMFLVNEDGGKGFKGRFAPVPDKIVQDGFEMIEDFVTTRKDYIAEINAGQAMPWRVIGVADNEMVFTQSDLVYNLATPPAEDVDWSWVKPGKAAWEWWHDWAGRGVDFKVGMNTRTYEYYIDFAAAFGLEYMLIDAGWNVHNSANLFAVVPELDLPHVVKYAEERGVGVVLWAGYIPFNRDMEAVCKHYSEMGVKGFKVDFMDRDDQDMVDFFTRAAETTARYHMILDFHGTFKPAGLTRTYPNVLNFEGVYAQENLKWATYDLQPQPEYDCTIPFVRMYAGPIDYNTGAYRNATQWNYRVVYNEPMSYGTRCHQVAEFIVFDAYFQMLVDSPYYYYQEPECTRFIAGIPECWDETIGLKGGMSDSVVMARRSGSDWYIGALCNWDWRMTEIPLDFMEPGLYQVTICQDGVNTHVVASDYFIKTFVTEVKEGDTLNFPMASGGGYAAHYKKL